MWGGGYKTLTPHHASGEILDYSSEVRNLAVNARSEIKQVFGFYWRSERREYIMYIYYLQNHNGEVC